MVNKYVLSSLHEKLHRYYSLGSMNGHLMQKMGKVMKILMFRLLFAYVWPNIFVLSDRLLGKICSLG